MKFNWALITLMASLGACLTWELYAEPVVPEAPATEIPEGAVDKLSSDSYQERKKAYEELEKWGESNPKTSPEVLYKAWKGNDDPEAKSRCYRLMRELLLERDFPGKGFLGIFMVDAIIQHEGERVLGVRVQSVIADTAAEKAGLRMGDTIIRVDDLEVGAAAGVGGVMDLVGSKKFSTYIQTKPPGTQVVLHLIRAGKLIEVKATLKKRTGKHIVPSPDSSTEEHEKYFKGWLKKMSE